MLVLGLIAAAFMCFVFYRLRDIFAGLALLIAEVCIAVELFHKSATEFVILVAVLIIALLLPAVIKRVKRWRSYRS